MPTNAANVGLVKFFVKFAKFLLIWNHMMKAVATMNKTIHC
jgi:hypothetical protein